MGLETFLAFCFYRGGFCRSLLHFLVGISQAHLPKHFRRFYLLSSLIFVITYVPKLFVMGLETFLAFCVYRGGFCRSMLHFLVGISQAHLPKHFRRFYLLSSLIFVITYVPKLFVMGL
jgi:uncharacterized membrane protein (DUF485 family)